MSERLGNLGYAAFIPEATKGTPLTPNFFLPLYKENLTTSLDLIKDNPVAGNKFATYAAVQGLRNHRGQLELYAEPNGAAYIADMLLTRGNVSGVGPYTWPYTLSTTTNPRSYTVDISTGNVVSRFIGVEASKLGVKWDKNEMHFVVDVSGLSSFHGRQIATITGAGPYTVTLDTTYDPSPTTGLVVGDLIRFYHAGSATVDATVATITNATTFTTTTNPTPAIAGDFVYLRPQTPTYNLLNPFQWARTQFQTASTAAAALSASQIRVESGSQWEVMHKFESDTGAQRSGAYDPAALVRTQGDGALKVKKYFDTPDDLQNWEQINKTAWVIRHFSGTTNQYELRITFNNAKIGAGVKPSLETAKILYSEEDYIPVYDSSDSAGMGITVINNLSTF